MPSSSSQMPFEQYERLSREDLLQFIQANIAAVSTKDLPTIAWAIGYCSHALPDERSIDLARRGLGDPSTAAG